jgi:hypothetical protein
MAIAGSRTILYGYAAVPSAQSSDGAGFSVTRKTPG